MGHSITPIEGRQTSLAVLADEINAHHRAAEAALNRGLEEAHKCGELLLEAKASCPHGTWQKWLADNFRGSTRSAQCYMRIANHWQEIEAKSADSALLSIDGAVKLLAAPKPKEKPSAPPTAPEPDEPADGWCLICGSTANCDCAEKFGSPAEVLGQRDADELSAVTCPNCGREVSPDDDGDCPQCREPKIDQVEQAVGQSALPPAPEPRPCMFTDKMKDDLEELFGALDNARRWAMHESIFDTAEWKSNGQEIRTKIRAVWSAFSDLQRAAEDSGIFADEEADQ